jgi:hypothetical protein
MILNEIKNDKESLEISKSIINNEKECLETNISNLKND